ncbi:helix-turn-helix domain-containing protein [Streptomyces sp. NPDC002403]
MSDLVGTHLSPSAQEALRLRAVAALVAGWDREDVVAVFGVSLKAVDTWWAKWGAGGWDALAMRHRPPADRPRASLGSGRCWPNRAAMAGSRVTTSPPNGPGQGQPGDCHGARPRPCRSVSCPSPSSSSDCGKPSQGPSLTT